MRRKLALNLDELNVETTEIVFTLDEAAYAGSVIIRTNTEPISDRCTAPTHCCA